MLLWLKMVVIHSINGFYHKNEGMTDRSEKNKLQTKPGKKVFKFSFPEI